MKSKILAQDSKKDTHNWKKNVCEWSRNRDSTDQHAEDEASPRNGWMKSSVKPGGAGRESLIPMAHAVQTMTCVQACRTSQPKGKLVMKMNVQWIWMRCRQSWRRRRVLLHPFVPLVSDLWSTANWQTQCHPKGRPTKEEMQKKGDEYQESKKSDRE